MNALTSGSSVGARLIRQKRLHLFERRTSDFLQNCLLPTADCLPPTACCLPPTAYLLSSVHVTPASVVSTTVLPLTDLTVPTAFAIAS